jgi:biotin operon repressor
MSMPEDPMMLYSFLNMKLRDEYPSLDALCEDLNVSKDEILKKMKSIGFEYDSERNRFW